jgi:ubiquinone/menaquinone biosynthesis C-methylase UbiE
MNGDRITEVYYNKLYSHRVQRELQNRIHWMRSQVKGNRILDIGCSQGILPILLARAGYSVIGLDINKEAIDYAEAEKNRESDSTKDLLEFVNCSVFDFDLEDGHFDTVYIGEVIEHLSNPQQVIELAVKATHPNGRVVITTPFGLHEDPEHCQVFYLKNFMELVDSLMQTEELDLIGKRICYTGRPSSEEALTKHAAVVDLLDISEKGFLDAETSYLQDNHFVHEQLRVKTRELIVARDKLLTVHEELGRVQKEYESFRMELDGKESEETQRFLEKIDRTGEGVERRVGMSGEHNVGTEDSFRVITKMLTTIRDSDKETVRELLRKIEIGREELEKLKMKRTEDLEEKTKTTNLLRSELEKETKMTEQLRIELKEKSKDSDRLLLESAKQKNMNEGLITRISEAGELIAQKDRYIKNLRQTQKRAEQLADEYRAKAEKHYNSVRYCLGDMLIRAGRPSIDTLAMPGELASLFARGISQKKNRGEIPLLANTSSLEETVKSILSFFKKHRSDNAEDDGSLSSTVEKKESLSESAKAMVSLDLPNATLDRTPRQFVRQALDVSDWHKPTSPGQLKVFSIMDEFTSRSYEAECHLIQPRPDNWESLARHELPDFLFVESAWKGNGGSWQYRVAHYDNPPGRELVDLVNWFRRLGLPTVFWNKEDPVHFSQFLDSARLFDFVFTSDSNMIPEYKKQLGHDKVAVMPFAAQPRFNSPIALPNGRNDRICFAGSYYANRFENRRAEMDWLLDAGSQYALDIFNRNHGSNGPGSEDFRFPDRFQPFIRGRLQYCEMLQAYKRYRLFLNVNSVIDSPTMFSRRVFELLACGTPVVSTYCQGIEELLGTDTVWMVKGVDEARAAIETLISDDMEWKRRSLAGIRKVFEHHTYRRRLSEIVENIGFDIEFNYAPSVLFVAQVATQSEYRRVVESFLRQKYKGKELVILSRARKVDIDITDEVLVINGDGHELETLERILVDKRPKFIGVFSAKCVYGAHYVEDLVYAAEYSNAEMVGKSTESTSIYKFQMPVHHCGCFYRREIVQTYGKLSDLFERNSPQKWISSGARCFAADDSNFIPDFDGWKSIRSVNSMLKSCEI